MRAHWFHSVKVKRFTNTPHSAEQRRLAWGSHGVRVPAEATVPDIPEIAGFPST